MEWISVKSQLPRHRERAFFLSEFDLDKGVFLEKLINEHGEWANVFMSSNGG